MAEPAVFSRIRDVVQDNDVVLFMKGVNGAPQCGFSQQVMLILNHLGVEFTDVNVLADQDIREGIKAFSDWPTIPQLYVGGEFVGGSDIMGEMAESGELHEVLQKAGATA